MGVPLLRQKNQNEEFLNLFTGTAGVHAVAQKIDGYMKHYYTKELLNQQHNTRVNVYFSPNTSKTWSRRKSQVCEINAICVDLDYYKFGYNKSQIMNILPVLFDDLNLFMPTAIQDSGNGLYLWWRLESQIVNNQIIVRLYERITKALQNKLRDYGADPKSTDVLHLFRLPGTINVKGKKKKESYIDFLNPNAIYELQDFADETLDELPSRPIKAVKTQKKGQIRGAVKHLFNPYTLAKTRVRDMIKLAEIRNYDLCGCRDNFLHIYAVQLKQANMIDFEQKVYDMNDLFTVPLRKEKVKATIKVLNDKEKKGSSVYEQSYMYKNETIILHLEIDETEQKEMRTIIGANESKKRDRERKRKGYAETKIKNQIAIEQRDKRIRELKNEGYTHQQVIEKMKSEDFEKVSKTTIKRAIRKERT